MENIYKLLIVDDDAIIRRGLSQLIDWENHHFQVVEYAADGEQAWEIIESQAVDIVVSDIKMPYMDGIGLLEKIREKYPDIRVILLTGYEEFEYARQAIKYKAFDYLLKPVDSQQLLETVQRAAYSLRENRKIQKNVNENMEMKRKNFYLKLLEGTLTSQETNRQAAVLEVPLMQNGLSFVMAVYLDFYDAGETAGEAAKETKKETKNAAGADTLAAKRAELLAIIADCSKKMAEHSMVPVQITVSDYKENQLEILLTTESLDAKAWKRELDNYARALLETVIAQCGFSITVGMGKVQRDIAGLHNSYLVANKALKSRHLSGKGQIIDGMAAVEPEDSITEIALPSDRLLQHIRLGFQDEVVKDVENIFKNLLDTGYISLESVRMIATELAIVCFKGQTMTGEGAVSYLYFLNEIQRMTTVADLKQKVLELAVSITKERGHKKTSQRQLAEDALQYMNEHFAEESLSLGQLAKEFHVSQTYMSIVLKQETENNFSAHLLNLRMQRAMELLRRSDVKHYEVAEQVGYSNSQYFAVCFKKYTGMTPTQFKEQ